MRNSKRSFLKKLAFIMPGAFAGIWLVFLGSGPANARRENVTPLEKDVSNRALHAITVESWDRDYSGNGYGWRVFTNRDTKAGKTTAQPVAYQWLGENVQVEREVKLIKGSPNSLPENRDYDQARVLAVRFAFTFPGNNVVSIAPPDVDQYTHERVRYHLAENAAVEQLPRMSCYKDPIRAIERRSGRAMAVACVNGVNMPGLVHEISVWVMGRGDDYIMEAWLEDWQGNVHVLRMGSVNFIGWRPLSVKIPKRIPQDIDSYPQVRTLVLRKLKLRSRTRGKSSFSQPVYIFFDELRVLANVFQFDFDGYDLDFDRIDCERKNSLYRILRANARVPEKWPKIVDCSQAPAPAAPIQQGQQ